MSPTLAPEIIGLLQSPSSGQPLHWQGQELVSPVGESFPVVGDIPILIDETLSAFSVKAFVATEEHASRANTAAIRKLVKRLVPKISHNVASTHNYRHLVDELDRDGPGPHRVLVVGGSIAGDGFQVLERTPSILLVETDVAYGPRTQIICDGHALPFTEGSFDAVVCQAVLEHVADPPGVVAEIHRVLRPRGLVYSEIPFMQQVHEGAHDFTRYTLIGHRRLYRQFECLDSGPTAGPGTSLAWSLKYVLLTLAGTSTWARNLTTVAANYLLFWLKYLDYPLLRLPTATDAASGTYVLGRRSDQVITDRELLSRADADGAGFRIMRV